MIELSNLPWDLASTLILFSLTMTAGSTIGCLVYPKVKYALKTLKIGEESCK